MIQQTPQADLLKPQLRDSLRHETLNSRPIKIAKHAKDARNYRPKRCWPSAVRPSLLARIAIIFTAQLCLLAVARPVTAAQQVIRLSSGWNLISITAPPANPAVQTVLAPLISEDSFQSMWTFDAKSGKWRVFKIRGEDVPPIRATMIPPELVAASNIETIATGKGYWVLVTRATTLTVTGNDIALPSPPADLVTGWNLIGFAADSSIPYGRLLSDPAVREIWTFDAAGSSFRGVVLPPTGLGPPSLEDFTALNPGSAYWVLTSGTVSLKPNLATAVPGDVDVPPLLPDAPPTVAKVWTVLTPGDEDVGHDGFYDPPSTQRALTFRSTTTAQSISLLNNGKGVLNWHAVIEHPDPNLAWLRFRILDAHDITELSGGVAAGTTQLNLLCDRTGLPPGEYRASIRISTNDSTEPARIIKVSMQVLDLDGDYTIQAKIKTINGTPADTANPRLFMSLYGDRDGLKAIIDESRTLLFPKRLRLAGGVYQITNSKLIISGSFELPPGCPDSSSGACTDNPYPTALRRDLTLIGHRRARDNPNDVDLGPLDLKGDYRETIRGALGQPIYLQGSFVANRLTDKPSVSDRVSATAPTGGPIPDNGGILQRTFLVTEKLIINEVDVTLNVEHERPEDLLITVESPRGKIVRLRDHSTNSVGLVRYDDDAPATDSLQTFNGERSDGTWTLRLEDKASGMTGSLLNAELHIRGTTVHSIGGTITNFGVGVPLLLTGCGIVRTTMTAANGVYLFDDLIDCPYRITVHQSGLQSISRDLVVAGSDLISINLSPGNGPPDLPIEVFLPQSPRNCGELCSKFASLTMGGSAGTLRPFVQLQYGMDAATFDLDRLPLGLSAPGREDTDVFLDFEDPLTGSNACVQAAPSFPKPELVKACLGPPLAAGSGRIDPSIGKNSYHIFVTIGLPVVGVSISTEGQLVIGGNP